VKAGSEFRTAASEAVGKLRVTGEDEACAVKEAAEAERGFQAWRTAGKQAPRGQRSLLRVLREGSSSELPRWSKSHGSRFCCSSRTAMAEPKTSRPGHRSAPEITGVGRVETKRVKADRTQRRNRGDDNKLEREEWSSPVHRAALRLASAPV